MTTKTETLKANLDELNRKIDSVLDRGDRREAETLMALHEQLYRAWRKSLAA